ncbi:hypothetical protein ANO11243_070300 [Dothideomycetidae sp. 11243]|nr:hypothetical protein ANO11243_070300 [fungal sp. No.11243]
MNTFLLILLTFSFATAPVSGDQRNKALQQRQNDDPQAVCLVELFDADSQESLVGALEGVTNCCSPGGGSGTDDEVYCASNTFVVCLGAFEVDFQDCLKIGVFGSQWNSTCFPGFNQTLAAEGCKALQEDDSSFECHVTDCTVLPDQDGGGETLLPPSSSSTTTRGAIIASSTTTAAVQPASTTSAAPTIIVSTTTSAAAISTTTTSQRASTTSSASAQQSQGSGSGSGSGSSQGQGEGLSAGGVAPYFGPNLWWIIVAVVYTAIICERVV